MTRGGRDSTLDRTVRSRHARALAAALLVGSLPLTLGSLLGVPFAVLTAAPGIGRAMVRSGLCATREEIAPPWEIARLWAGGAEAAGS